VIYGFTDVLPTAFLRVEKRTLAHELRYAEGEAATDIAYNDASLHVMLVAIRLEAQNRAAD
jgi:hypothetical protein